jgi:subtilisin family serine protease
LNLADAHQVNRGTKPNGDPVRIGIIDDGVYPHDHLDVREDLSVDLTDDGDFASAINAAIATNCDVINASLGFVKDLPEGSRGGVLESYVENYIEDLADTADQFGIVWVASAGNSANNANDLVPGSAKADNVLSVSSVGPTGIARPDGEGGTILGDPLEPSTTPASYTTHGNEYVDVSAPGGSWDVYFEPPDTDEEGVTIIDVFEAIREHVAPDGVLSTYPPDTFGASLLTGEFLGLSDPLPTYVMYGVPSFFDEGPVVGKSEFNSNYSTPYQIPFSSTPDELEYNLYYTFSLDGEGNLQVSSYVNPDTVTDEMTFLASFAVPSPVYGSLQGTSMSAPQVTGVAALLSAENPEWTPQQIRRVIRATAREVGKTTYHGHGMVDPVAALEVDDPAEVRDDLGRPGDRDDRGRNERSGGSPRDGSGGDGSSGRGRGDDDDGDDDDEDRGR